MHTHVLTYSYSRWRSHVGAYRHPQVFRRYRTDRSVQLTSLLPVTGDLNHLHFHKSGVRMAFLREGKRTNLVDGCVNRCRLGRPAPIPPLATSVSCPPRRALPPSLFVNLLPILRVTYLTTSENLKPATEAH